MWRVLSFPSSLSSFPGYAVEIHSSHSTWLAGMYGSSAFVHACGSMILQKSDIFFMAMRVEKWAKIKEVEDVEQVLG